MTQRLDSVFGNDIILNEPGDHARLVAEQDKETERRIAKILLLLAAHLLSDDDIV